MALTLEVTSRKQREQLGDKVVQQFGREGGTIGRSEANDWRLPDAERYISSHHATIDFQAGSYYLIDTSTNGVYVNGSEIPVGASKPQRLFDGDTLRMGEYVISVTIDEGFDLLTQDEDHRSSIAREDLVPVDDDPTELAMVDAEEITGSQALNARLSENSSRDTSARSTADTSIIQPPQMKIRRRRTANVTPMHPVTATPERVDSPPPAPAPKSTASDTQMPQDAVEAFLRGLGISREDLGRVDSLRLMHNAGLALREFVLGSMELLQNRAAVKNTFRLEQTTIQPNVNNPLKFSASADDAIRNLLAERRAQYGPTVDSIREAWRDLKQHEIAIICAMRDAFKDFADRLDPDELEQKFDDTARRGSLFSGGSKARYWELYRDLYQVMTQRPEGQFPHLFGEEFASAYTGHVERLRREANLKREPVDKAGSLNDPKKPDKPKQAEA